MTTVKLISTLMLCTFISLVTFASHGKTPTPTEQTGFVKELEMFAGYLGTWESNFAVAEGERPVIDVTRWERALNGKALKTIHSINNGEYGGESYIFFDHDKQALVFYYFTTANFYTQGSLEIIDDTSFAAYEDVTGNENGITKVKSTSKLMGETISVSTSYLKNGQWTKPQTRTYVRSTKDVIFK
ncbi:hypothetical protein LP316_10360 [Thalassotalea sp. LPB0316]|uniref:hypothetical protein n=1 Tax=Thalassotalea sp. LPB0316 TaxID=2769490 RepID=UPI001867E279|nr:hypothetical protein [Thalassotalea sp. LPB0316]QOL24732.1 hypothetical protein LP316_10360 [Thalassotalea sp. LPB0316]